MFLSRKSVSSLTSFNSSWTISMWQFFRSTFNNFRTTSLPHVYCPKHCKILHCMSQVIYWLLQQLWRFSITIFVTAFNVCMDVNMMGIQNWHSINNFAALEHFILFVSQNLMQVYFWNTSNYDICQKQTENATLGNYFNEYWGNMYQCIKTNNSKCRMNVACEISKVTIFLNKVLLYLIPVSHICYGVGIVLPFITLLDFPRI